MLCCCYCYDLILYLSLNLDTSISHIDLVHSRLTSFFVQLIAKTFHVSSPHLGIPDPFPCYIPLSLAAGLEMTQPTVMTDKLSKYERQWEALVDFKQFFSDDERNQSWNRMDRDSSDCMKAHDRDFAEVTRKEKEEIEARKGPNGKHLIVKQTVFGAHARHIEVPPIEWREIWKDQMLTYHELHEQYAKKSEAALQSAIILAKDVLKEKLGKKKMPEEFLGDKKAIDILQGESIRLIKAYDAVNHPRTLADTFLTYRDDVWRKWKIAGGKSSNEKHADKEFGNSELLDWEDRILLAYYARPTPLTVSQMGTPSPERDLSPASDVAEYVDWSYVTEYASRAKELNKSIHPRTDSGVASAPEAGTSKQKAGKKGGSAPTKP